MNKELAETKNIKIHITVEIPQLYDIIRAQSVYTKLNEYIEVVSNQINTVVLAEWNLSFNILLQNTDMMSIAKCLAVYPSDEECVIYMSVPIPDETEVSYGISSVKEAFFKKVNEKYSVVVPFDFNDYNDLSQYIVDSSKRLIDISLERTYTLKEKKIKLGK